MKRIRIFTSLLLSLLLMGMSIFAYAETIANDNTQPAANQTTKNPSLTEANKPHKSAEAANNKGQSTQFSLFGA